MKDPFVNESFIDSPAKDSLSNIDGCYRKNFFNNKSFMNSRRALQTGAEKISKTFKSVRNTFDNLTQHFRVGGRRRHRLTETTSPCRTPATPVKKIRQYITKKAKGPSIVAPLGQKEASRSFSMNNLLLKYFIAQKYAPPYVTVM
ncbi:unnamed protein product [Leptidea sinapis]|uniref:Uncharacterized protein n=1 Tax=Leptidea sinapis TaxID=189913 RepID=A0A5E4QHU5_9NEOP|nr:unnamed protein product [Leptidea sinapis]